MKVEILNEHGAKLDEVESVTISPLGANSISTKHGNFIIDEAVIDYVDNVIRIYSESYYIRPEYEDEYNEWGIQLISK